MGSYTTPRSYYMPAVDEDYGPLVNTDTIQRINDDVAALFAGKVTIYAADSGASDAGHIRMTGNIRGLDHFGRHATFTGNETVAGTLGVTGAATVGNLTSTTAVTANAGNIHALNGAIWSSVGDVFAANGSVYAEAGDVWAGGDVYSDGGDVYSTIGNIYTVAGFISSALQVEAGSYVRAGSYVQSIAYGSIGTTLGVGVTGLSAPAAVHALFAGGPQVRLSQAVAGSIAAGSRYVDLYADTNGQMTIDPSGNGSAGSKLIFLSTNTAIRSNPFTSGVNGWNIASNGDSEFFNVVIRGALIASIIKTGEWLALGGTVLLSKNSGQFNAPFVVPGSNGGSAALVQIKKGNNNASVIQNGDILWVKTWISATVLVSLYFTVSAKDDTPTGYSTATLTLQSGAVGSFTLQKDISFINIGPTTGDTYMSLSADGTNGRKGNLTVVSHDGSPWLGGVHVWSTFRLGNIGDTGMYGSVDTWGMIAGNDIGLNALTFRGFSVDATNGLRMWNTAIAQYLSGVQTVNLTPAGTLALGTNVGAASGTTFLVAPAGGVHGAETLPAGAVLAGANTAGSANLLWHPSSLFGSGAAGLGFRSGLTPRIGIYANGTIGIYNAAGTLYRWLIDSANNMNFYDSAGSPVITMDSVGASYFAGPMTIGGSGGIWQGSGTFAAPTTGWKLSSSVSGGVQEWWYSGVNTTRIVYNGITQRTDPSYSGNGGFMKWTDGTGSGYEYGNVTALDSVSGRTFMLLANPIGANFGSELVLGVGPFKDGGMSRGTGGGGVPTAANAQIRLGFSDTATTYLGMFATQGVTLGGLTAAKTVGNSNVYVPGSSGLGQIALGAVGVVKMAHLSMNGNVHFGNNLYLDTGINWNLDDTSSSGTIVVMTPSSFAWYWASAGSNPRSVVQIANLGVDGTFDLSYSTAPMVKFSTGNVASPANGTWNGVRASYYPGSTPGFAVGIESGGIWQRTSSNSTGEQHRLYGGDTQWFQLRGGDGYTQFGGRVDAANFMSGGDFAALNAGVFRLYNNVSSQWAAFQFDTGNNRLGVYSSQSGTGTSAIAHINLANGTYTALSDRNLKTGLRDFDALAALERMPVKGYYFKRTETVDGWPRVVEEADRGLGMFIGPVAQDMHAAGFGNDPTMLADKNVAGLALRAAQQLWGKYKGMAAELSAVKRELAALKGA